MRLCCLLAQHPASRHAFASRPALLFDLIIYGDSIDCRDSADVAAAALAGIFRQAPTILAPNTSALHRHRAFQTPRPANLNAVFARGAHPARQGRRRPVSDQRSGNLQAETAAKVAQSLPKSRLSLVLMGRQRFL